MVAGLALPGEALPRAPRRRMPGSASSPLPGISLRSSLPIRLPAGLRLSGNPAVLIRVNSIPPEKFCNSLGLDFLAKCGAAPRYNCLIVLVQKYNATAINYPCVYVITCVSACNLVILSLCCGCVTMVGYETKGRQ
jgi:hypothetical protein